ncbi:response regulator transcription factor [Paraconexibacter antarcticus]|uniref:Response regulator transcription factor n=1 Tax=Paraconexibacter antarcticus TaxID=2949664 RepID=A0ABY5DUP6_9ACTN|nr:response regulator transcription factor [Paraconexibacter antarcticus]UTI65299.1 response regulator transcription factor [Paraconexibacter antarcticus]
MFDRPLTVLIADDSDAYRSGIARAVRAHADLELVGEVDGGDAALEAISELTPDIALLDVRMPGLDGLEVCQRVRAMGTSAITKVVLLSAYMDATVVARAREVGADGYLSKAASRREICSEAIRVGRGLD